MSTGIGPIQLDIFLMQLEMIGDVDPSWSGHDPKQIEEHGEQETYTIRNRGVYGLLASAAQLGLPHGFGPDPADPGWCIAYIELPTGQISWHLPVYPGTWDGHSTDEKYARIARLKEYPDGSAQ